MQASCSQQNRLISPAVVLNQLSLQIHIFWNKCLMAAAVSHCYVVAKTSLHVGVLLACSQLHLWTALLL